MSNTQATPRETAETRHLVHIENLLTGARPARALVVFLNLHKLRMWQTCGGKR